MLESFKPYFRDTMIQPFDLIREFMTKFNEIIPKQDFSPMQQIVL